MADLKKYRLVNIQGVKGLVIEYGQGKRGDGFYSWDDITDDVAAYLFSIGSHYVEKIEQGSLTVVQETAAPAPTSKKRPKLPKKEQPPSGLV